MPNKQRDPREGTVLERIDETDIGAISWTVAVFAQKLLPFFEAHSDHNPDFCPYASPSFVMVAENIIEHLQVIVEAYNEYLADMGKPPLASFGDITDVEGSFNA